jgi:hypothetical protein
MRRKQAKINWGAFGITLGICLAIGFPIVSHNNPLPMEFRNNCLILISTSFLVSIALGGWMFIRNALNKVWEPITARIAWAYIERLVEEYKSEIRISGIKNNSGTVNLILETNGNNDVFQGMRLDIVTQPGGERYGEVEVTQLSNDEFIASPTNRINVEFWEKLEDRMKSDPSPPPNVVAKRPVSDRLIESLKHLHKKERKHGY